MHENKFVKLYANQKAIKKRFMEFDLFDNFQCDQNNM